MKLNLDCIRRILLCVESNTGLRKNCLFIDSGLEEVELMIGNEPMEPPEYQAELLKVFNNDELIYHINYCVEARLLSAITPPDQYVTIISDITPQGHEFIANIRNDSFFNKVKEIGKDIGTNSLRDLTQIAAACATSMIKGYFNIP